MLRRCPAFGVRPLARADLVSIGAAAPIGSLYLPAGILALVAAVIRK